MYFAPGQFFTCTDCGKCCTSGWLVNVSEEMAAKIQETESYQRIKKEGYTPLSVVNGIHRLGRSDQDVCLYHHNDGCDLHRELGAREKPVTCRSYPFQVVEMEESYFVSLAYSCPAVLAGMGGPLNQFHSRLDEFLTEDSKAILRGPKEESGYPLTSDARLSWNDYLHLEKKLVQVDSADPVLFLLNAACCVIGQLVSGARLSMEELDFSRPHSLLGDAVDTFPIFAIACLSIVERELDYEEREVFAEALKSGLHPPSALLDAPCPNFEILQPDSQVIRDMLQRYIMNLVAGKRLLLGPTLISRVLMLSVSLALLLYYQRFQAELNMTRHFDFDQWEWAFETIELNLVTHNNDLQPYFQQFEKTLIAIAEVHQAPQSA